MLEGTLHPADDTLMLTASHTVSDAHSLILLFDESINKGLEGLVVKKPESQSRRERCHERRENENRTTVSTRLFHRLMHVLSKDTKEHAIALYIPYLGLTLQFLKCIYMYLRPLSHFRIMQYTNSDSIFAESNGCLS